VSFFAEADLGMFSMFGRTGAQQKEGANVGQQRDIFWSVGAPLACCELRHSWGAARQSLPYKYYKTSEFRKLYLKSGNSSGTAHSCNAEFMV